MHRYLVPLFVLCFTLPALGGEPAPLPPALPWSGASEALALPPDSDDPWITPAEKSGLTQTPNYDETVAYLNRVVVAAPELAMVSIGKSGNGRQLWMVIATQDGGFTPDALAKNGKPTIFAQAGIHSGEIDGKDAGLMLLRDLTVKGTKKALLDKVNLLFVPIFNPDGHERISAFGRVNQRGPERMGWRTNARNLNLNRDYAKADSPEIQSLLRALARWKPNLYVDLHVTNGLDYQYDITWGAPGPQGASPSISRWLSGVLDPAVSEDLKEHGHFPGGLVFGMDSNNPDAGLFEWSASPPRFSDGYGAFRHLPAILVENHSLKPYPQRVVGTYVFLESVMNIMGERGEELKRAVEEDRARRPQQVPLGFKVPDDVKPEMIDFLGVKWQPRESELTGGTTVEYLGEPITQKMPRIAPTEPTVVVERPVAYWVPAAWTDVIQRLKLHGIEMEYLRNPREVEVDLYRLNGAKTAEAPFEGRVRLELPEPPTVERRTEVYAPGSVRIPTDQPLGDLAIHLLEPQASDSFLQWGFFLEILSRTEYIEGYVIDPLAERMVAENPELKKEFEAALKADPELAENPRARRQWFYARSLYFDDRWMLYPVGREVGEAEE